MAKKIKISSSELDQVGGGDAIQEKPLKPISDLLEKLNETYDYVNIECRFCHKIFQYPRFWLMNWSGIDEDGSHYYDVHTCPECKKTHPFVSRKIDIAKGTK